MKPGSRVIDLKTDSLGTVRLVAQVGRKVLLIVDMDDGRTIPYSPHDLETVFE